MEKQINAIAYRLELLISMKIHLIFHILFLEIYKESNSSGRIQDPPPYVEAYVEVNDFQEYVIENILDSRI